MDFQTQDSPEFSNQSVSQHGPKERKEVAEHGKYMVYNRGIVIAV